MRRFYFSLLPWGVFAMSMRASGLDYLWGSSFALATTVLMAFLLRRDGVSYLQISGAVIFGGLLLFACLTTRDANVRPVVRSSAFGLLALAIGASLLAAPCTTRFLEAVIAPRYWGRRDFYTLNFRLSAMWAICFAAIAALGFSTWRTTSSLWTTLGNWILPLGLVIVAGLLTDQAIVAEFDQNEPTVGELVEALAELVEARESRHRTHVLRTYREEHLAP